MSAVKIKNERLEESVKPKNEGRLMPNIPKGPFVTESRFMKSEYIITESPIDASA